VQDKFPVYHPSVIDYELASLLLLTSIGQAQTLTTAQAKAHIGENATVCGKVVGEKTATSSKGEPMPRSGDSPPSSMRVGLGLLAHLGAPQRKAGRSHGTGRSWACLFLINRSRKLR
jgi:hypothetical protein